MIVLFRFILTWYVAFDILWNQRVTMVLVIACRVIALDFLPFMFAVVKNFLQK
jgi:hypothetical protein